jgi:8-oxo-dGTP pyrophosphatase MutT (NUDIX family)
MSDESPIRDAATIILARQHDLGPQVLMGLRGEAAAFMPNKYVFPGGAVDPDDADVPLATPLDPTCAGRLGTMANALAAAAIRELWEEAGLILGAPGDWPVAPPADWADFAATGHRPSAKGLRHVFRAITPPGRTRRFDARFFLADAALLAGDPDDFSRATDELSHLHWVPIAEARRLNLPFITEVALAEVAELMTRGGSPASVPFFDNSGRESVFRRL